jgi:hypothetical protein
VFVHKDGDVYEGFWKENMLHGKARRIRDTLGYEYGTYVDDKLHGYSVVV